MKARYLIYAGLLILFSACEKALLDKNPGNSPLDNVNSLYQTVRDKYSFFELKGINWDSVYQYYQPQLREDMSDEQLFTVLDSMLYDLRDGHVNLVSPFNISRNWQWYLNYPDNFEENVVERYYLGENHRRAGGIRYTIIDSVGYIYYPSFASGFTHENLDAVFSYLRNTSGLIVDVRSNGGGSLGNAFALAQRLVSEERTALITFEKTGPGPDDFGKGSGYTIGPSDYVNYNGPVVILTNRRCYSATNTFAGMLRGFDNITQMGAQTGGGGGIPVDYELPNGWYYRFSATRSLIPLDDERYYDIELGVPPDVGVTSPEAQLALGYDNILETALDLLRD